MTHVYTHQRATGLPVGLHKSRVTSITAILKKIIPNVVTSFVILRDLDVILKIVSSFGTAI